ncbi:MAG: hypothetical protein MJZ22_02960 [Candidatus Saccharibacteria bacterium]|nr:hypothetical protein [Candidatus Saccharibacteria bacterium]
MGLFSFFKKKSGDKIDSKACMDSNPKSTNPSEYDVPNFGVSAQAEADVPNLAVAVEADADAPNSAVAVEADAPYLAVAVEAEADAPNPEAAHVAAEV